MAAKRRRVTVDVNELGTPDNRAAGGTPRYNIIGDAGTPIGPSPVAQLASALGSVNKNLQVFGQWNAKAAEEKAASLIPDLQNYITESAADIHKFTQKHKIDPLKNPLVRSAAYNLIGERTGKKDVQGIVNSSEFETYAQEHIDEEGDFRQKLRNYVLANLPNRDKNELTTSKFWKKGYDPAVEDELDKSLVGHLQRQQDRELEQIRETNIVKAQETLRDAIVSGDATEFKTLMSAMSKFYPTDIRKGIRFNGEMLSKVVRPVFETALEDPDINIDDLESMFEKVINMRRATEKGSTVMWGGGAEVLKSWFAKAYDAETTQTSRSHRKDQAVKKELKEQMTNFGYAFPQFLEDNPDFVSMGISSMSDITVDNFDKIVKRIVSTGYIKFDDEKYERLMRGGKAALIANLRKELTDRHAVAITNEAKVEEHELALKKKLIKDHPEWKEVLEKLNVTQLLKDGTFNNFDGWYPELLANFDKTLVSCETKLPEIVVGSLFKEMVREHTDQAAASAAQNLIAYYNAEREKKIKSPEEIEQLKNVIAATFTDDGDTRDQFTRILKDLEADTNLAPFKKQIKFHDVATRLGALQDVEGEETSVLSRMLSYYRRNLSTVENQAYRDGESVELAGLHKGAATAVIAQMETAFDEATASTLREWANNTVDLEENFNPVTIRNEIIEKMKGQVKDFERAYQAIVQKEDDDEKGNRADALTGVPHLSKDVVALDQSYTANMEEFQDFGADRSLTYSQLRGNDKIGVGNEQTTAVASFFADTDQDVGDTRYGRLDQITEQAAALTNNLQEHLSGLYIEKKTDQAKQLNDPNTDRASAIQKKINDAESQLVAHYVRYEGVNWEDVSDKTASIKWVSSAGEEHEIPIGMKDIGFSYAVLHPSWESLDEIEDHYDTYERTIFRDRAKAEGKETYTLGGRTYNVSDKIEELTDDQIERVRKYTGFIKTATGIDITLSDQNLLNPQLLGAMQKAHLEWAKKQREQMVSTDPDKMPQSLNQAIKRQALKNFYKTKRWKGREYTDRDVERVKAAAEYNEFISRSDFSLEKGVSLPEFLKLYSGLTSGHMWTSMHHLRGGHARGPHGGSWGSEPVPEKELTSKQKDIIAQEAAVAAMGYRNPTGSAPDGTRTGIHKKAPYKGHPYNVMRPKYMAEFRRIRNLLEKAGDTRDPELAKVFKTLYDSQDPDRDYMFEPAGVSPLDLFPSTTIGRLPGASKVVEGTAKAIGKASGYYTASQLGSEIFRGGSFFNTPLKGAKKYVEEETGAGSLLNPFDMELLPLPHK